MVFFLIYYYYSIFFSINSNLNIAFRFIDIKQFAIRQGYRTENQLGFFKKCTDHHKSWDSICEIYRHAMTCELLWPYVVETANPSVNGYLNWVEKQDDSIYKLKFEQVILNSNS